jgi:hypothetical protein
MIYKSLALIILGLMLQAQASTQSTQVIGTLSPWLEIIIDDETTSFLIGLESESAQYLYVADLIDPEGEVYIKSNHHTPSASRIPPFLYTSLNSRNRITLTSQGLGSALIPNTPYANIRTGKWRMRVAAKEAVQTVHYTIIQKSRARTSKRVDLPIIIPEGMSLIDAQALVSEVEKIYGQHGLALKLHIESSLVSSQLPMQLDEWVTQLQTGSSTRPVLHLLENEDLPFQKTIQGYAGCLPVFQTQVTAQHCALAVVINPHNPTSFEQLVKVLAHELGHFFGLYHLEDDYYPYGRLRSTLVDHNDQTNLNIMHETSEYFGDLIFTAKQVEVMKRHPIFYH